MMALNLKFAQGARYFSTSICKNAKHECKLLIVGGGTGGCSMAAKFARHLKKDNDIIIVEPSKMHYYQPYFTLIGGGIETLKASGKQMSSVLPSSAKRLDDAVKHFDPKENSITTEKGDTIKYDYMIVAVGLQLNYNKIPGLMEGLQMDNCLVSSIYSPKYVERTYKCLQNFESGNAIFTFPNTSVKCPGAPQKICYVSEDYLRKQGKRNNATIMYNTSLPVIFGVKKYADALWQVVKERDIKVNLRTNLVEVKPDKKIAVFENLDKPGEKIDFEYSLLHVTPPMSAPDVLSSNKELTNEQGFMNVDKDTMQHLTYKNVFSIGDCSGTPNSKTAAAAAAQAGVIYHNLRKYMKGLPLDAKYDGYASCPLVTGVGKCILAEFDYNLMPLETFPFNQSKESLLMYIMKKDAMPILYWNLMLKGWWNGPAPLRTLMHFGLK